MMKKILCAMTVLLVLFLALTPAFANTMDDNFEVMYVNCPNGKTLNLRDGPNGKKIGSLENGTKVYISGGFIEKGWVAVTTASGKSGVVKSEFLQSKKPGKYEITEREDNFIDVRKPYIVNAKPLNAKTDMSVGLRPKPNKTSKAIRRLQAGDQLLVLASGNVWLQVEDLETGRIGYVAEDYTEFDHWLVDETPVPEEEFADEFEGEFEDESLEETDTLPEENTKPAING